MKLSYKKQANVQICNIIGLLQHRMVAKIAFNVDYQKKGTIRNCAMLQLLMCKGVIEKASAFEDIWGKHCDHTRKILTKNCLLSIV